MIRERLRSRLAEVFARREGGAAEAQSRPDADTIWRAVAGELGAEEVAQLADRMVDDPELAREWRLALDLQSGEVREAGAVVTPMPGAKVPWRLASLAAAATLILGFGSLFWWRAQTPVPVFRGEVSNEILALNEPEASLPRDDFVLRWTNLGAEATYALEVSNAQFQLLVRLESLMQPSARVPSSALDSVAAGGQVRWQVIGTTATGEEVRSAYFWTTVP